MNKHDDLATRFAVCVDNEGNEASLELGKLYEVIRDDEAVKHGYLRVIDESGEDYWHAAKMFYLIEVPSELATTLHNLYRAA
ncbi:MAG: hypothetical protein JMDDDDMK_04593 [Acidobacteria bacterium]|nr:hypothetical protein [Acidobacteriota bacterium]